MHIKRWSYVQDVWQQLDGTDFRLLEILDYYQRTYGSVFLARETLAKKLKRSVSTVSRHVSKLVSLGVLAVQHRRYRRRDGTFDTRSNVYRLCTLAGAKIRALVTRLAGVARTRFTNKKEKKEDLSEQKIDFSFVKNENLKDLLTRFARKKGQIEGQAG